MDLLGKQGEKALEDVERFSRKLEDLESHLDAVDSALQDFMGQSRQLMEETYRFEEKQVKGLEDAMEDEDLDIRQLEDRFKSVERKLERLRKRQAENTKRIETIMDSELLDIVERVRKMINNTNRRYNKLRDSLGDLEQRINELENDFMMEVNSREFDFERKVDSPDYEADQEEIRNELKKMRASINILAEELDKKNDIKSN